MVLPFVLIEHLILFGLLAASGSLIYLSPGWDEISFSPSRKGRQDGCVLCANPLCLQRSRTLIFPSFILNY